MGMKRTLTAGIGAGLALVMMACGSEGPDTTDPVEPPTQAQTADEQEPVEATPGGDPTEAADEGAGAAGALLQCEDEAVLAATEAIRTRAGLTVLFGDSLEEVTNCLWGLEGDSDSLQINIQYWTLGGDAPDQATLDMLTLERIEDPDLDSRGLVVAHEGEGRETVWAFGHGFQVWARPDRIEVTQEELVQLATSLVEEMA